MKLTPQKLERWWKFHYPIFNRFVWYTRVVNIRTER